MKQGRIINIAGVEINSRMIGSVLLVIILLFVQSKIYLLSGDYNRIICFPSYLTWHNLMEFTIITISMAIFIVSYFTYYQNNSLRSVFTGTLFFTFGVLEFFHAVSFKGMPDFFFLKNDGSKRTILFWMVMVIIQSLGFLITSFIPLEKKSKLTRRLFIIPAILLIIFIFVIITNYSDLLPVMYIEGKGLTKTKIILEMLVIVLLSITLIRYTLEYIRKRQGGVNLVVMTYILCIFSEVSFTQYVGVYDIYNCLGHFYRIIAFLLFFKIMVVNSVQMPYYELAAARDEIKSHADNLDRIVKERTRELTRSNQKLLDDLEYARDIQKSMLPSVLPEVDEASFCTKYFPAEKLGGDYYNIIRINHDKIAICIGDVSGHGVSAAMLTVFLNQSIHAVSEGLSGDMDRINAPSQVLKDIFNAFNKANFKDEVYIVFFYAILDINKMELTYSSAGFNVAPLILRNDDTIEVEIRGFPICKIGEIVNVDYEDRTIKLQKADKIILCTDGLIEAENDKKDQYTYERLGKVLSGMAEKSCEEIADRLEEDVFGFIGDLPAKDDITTIVMEINR